MQPEVSRMARRARPEINHLKTAVEMNHEIHEIHENKG